MATIQVSSAPSRVSPGLKLVHLNSNDSQTDRSLESRLDRLRIAEALMARDHVVYQMESLCASNRSKELTIAELQREKAALEKKLASSVKVPGIIKVDLGSNKDENEQEYRELEQENNTLRSKLESLLKQRDSITSPRTDASAASPSIGAKSPLLDDEVRSPPIDVHSPLFSNPPEVAVSQETEAVTQARYAVLAELPIPPEMPSDMLVPFVIPAPYTLQDFLGAASGSLKIQLANYRIFQESTTFWCPDREEHGYYVTPVFKCNTNPRVTTAHRWTPVELASAIDQTAECFFNKEGKWYYAGVYRTFRLRDLTPEEWVRLPTETTQVLVKETLSQRKNTSPQNVYETGQLYAAGALKGACIGLQCIGFNEGLYRGLLVLADGCSKTGRWRAPVAGLGTGATWPTVTSPRLEFEQMKISGGLADFDPVGMEKTINMKS